MTDLPVKITTKKEYDECYEAFVILLDIRRLNSPEDKIRLRQLDELISQYEEGFTFGHI